MGNPVIVDAVRTPLGKRKGWLAGVHPAALLGFAQAEVLRRAGVDPELVDQVVGGCVTQAGEQSNDMVRRAWLYAGLPQHTGATADRRPVRLGPAVRAPGARHGRRRAPSTSASPAGSSRCRASRSAATSRPGSGDPRPDDWAIDMPNQFEAADRIAGRRGLTRADLDAFGLASQQKARVAVDEGRFKREIAPYRPLTERSRRRPGRRRPGAARHHARGAGRPQAGAPRRPAHRRHVVADLRRRLRRADHGRGQGPRPRPDPAGPDQDPLPGRLGPLLPPRRPDRGDPEAARPHRHGDLRLRPVRGQRGLRLRRPVVGRPAPASTWTRSTSTAARSRSATRSAPPAPG